LIKLHLLVENGSNVVAFNLGTTGQILTIDTSEPEGLRWVDKDEVGEFTTASNIGITGSNIFLQKTGVDFEFKGLIAGDNVYFQDDNQNITINSIDTVIDTTASNIGITSDGNLYLQEVSDDLQFRGLIGGQNITIYEDQQNITIDFESPTTTKGDLLVDNGTELVRLPIGTTGQVLTVNTSNPNCIVWDEIGEILDIGEDNTASNIGVTSDGNIFFQKVGEDLEFKGLLAGDNITIIEDQQNIIISAADDKTTGTNIGVTGFNIFSQETGDNLEFKGLIEGTNIELIEDAQNITINAIDATTVSNIGITGSNIFLQKTGDDLQFKGLIAGDNVYFQDDNQNITINSIDTVIDTTASNIGITSDGNLYLQEVSDDLQFRGLLGGQNITIYEDQKNITIDFESPTTTKGDLLVDNGTELVRLPLGTTGQVLTVDTTAPNCIIWDEIGEILDVGEDNTASNIGVTGSDIFFQKSGIDLEFRGLLAGDNITLVQDDKNIIISAADDKTTATNIGITGFNVFSDETGDNLEFKGLIEGTNIELIEDAQNITINAIDATTVSNLGITGSNIFLQEVGDDLQFKGLIAGDNIYFEDDNQNITINSIDTVIDTTASNIGVTSNGNLYLQEVSDDLQFRGLLGGQNITIYEDQQNITIDFESPTTTKGDILVDNGTELIRFPIGISGQVLSVDDTTESCLKWEDISDITGMGEVNTASNIGVTSDGNLFLQKTGVDLEFRGLLEGSNITLLEDNQNITIKSHNDIAVIRDEKAEGTAGGAFTAGAWRERDLNTLEQNGSIVSSLSGNEFTLIAGEYILDATVPAYAVDNHKARLFNVTDSIVEVYGTSSFALNNGSSETTTLSNIKAFINISSNKTFRIEHHCESTKGGDGFGLATGWGEEIYTNIIITKVN
jgi:hypothetical protein